MIEPKTEKLIEKWCPDDRKTELRMLMENQCTATAFHFDENFHDLLERVQLAIIRDSSWVTDLIQQRIQRDSVDFRDLLMARGFGELEAHTRWWKEAIATGKID